MSRDTEEFIALSENAARAVSGPSSRHAALIEDAFSLRGMNSSVSRLIGISYSRYRPAAYLSAGRIPEPGRR